MECSATIINQWWNSEENKLKKKLRLKVKPLDCSRLALIGIKNRTSAWILFLWLTVVGLSVPLFWKTQCQTLIPLRRQSLSPVCSTLAKSLMLCKCTSSIIQSEQVASGVTLHLECDLHEFYDEDSRTVEFCWWCPCNFTSLSVQVVTQSVLRQLICTQWCFDINNKVATSNQATTAWSLRIFFCHLRRMASSRRCC